MKICTMMTISDPEAGADDILRVAKRLEISLTSVCAVFLLAGMGAYGLGLRFESPERFAAGLALGWACSAAKVYMMTRSFCAMLRDTENAGARFMANMAAKYAVTIAAAMPVLFFAGTFGPVGFLGGLLSMPVGGYVSGRR
jgi:hypothetical protein